MTKPDECHCCGFEMTQLTQYPPTVSGKHQEVRWLCDLCAGSLASNMDDYRHYDPDAVILAKVICYVGNEIIATIKRRRRGPS